METLDTTTPPLSQERLEFHGTGGAYFKIWIVNTLLTIITLGIYGPWAKIRAKKYLLRATQFKGSSFDYHAKPLPLLKGRIIAMIILMIYAYGSLIHPIVGIIGFILFFLSFPFFLIKSYKFNFANTSLQNIRFALRARMDEAYKLYFKILGIPTIINLLILSIRSFASMGKTEKKLGAAYIAGDPFLIIALIANIILIVYYVKIMPRIFNAIYSTIYNNASYGGLKTNIDSNPKSVQAEIVKPYLISLIKIIVPTLLIFIGILFASTMIPALKILLPFGIFFLYGAIFILSLLIPFYTFSYIWSRVSTESVTVKTDLTWKEFRNLSVKNALLILVTLGLYYPFAKVAMIKLKMQARLFSAEDFEATYENIVKDESAISDEVGDAFDFDLDIGL